MLSRLREIVKSISRSPLIDEEKVKEIIKEIQRALIMSDVNPRVVADLSRSIEEEMKSDKRKLPGVSEKERLIKTVYDKLVELLGGKEHYEPRLDNHRILMVGLYGQGKTTTIGKIAKYYAKKGKKVGVICCDVERPAAYEQIKQLAEAIPVPYYGDPKEKKAKKVLKDGLNRFRDLEIVVVDSAGRNALDPELAKELKEIHGELKPEEVFLVVGADLGNAASTQALAFREIIPVTGVIITRMDSSGKAGGALSACARIKVPVTFVGIGEKPGDLEMFEAEGFVSRLLGFGDISGLLKKVKEVAEEEEFSPEKLMTENFNLRLFYQQLKAMKKMGPLQKVMEMMGLVNIPKEMIETSEEKLKIYQYIMDSMTKKELEDPELIDNSRIKRIAKGSGTKEKDVKELLKQYKMSKKMVKSLKGGKLPRKFRALGKMTGLPMKF